MEAYVMFGGVVAVIIAFAAAIFYGYPYLKRKQALRMKPGDESATPIPRQNPKIGKTNDEFVDIGSEPNPFLEGLKGNAR